MRTAPLRFIAAFGAVLTLGACKTFSPDGGMDVAATFARNEMGKDVAAIRTTEEAAAAQARVRALLKRPLTADAAVQVALLNNRGLQAAYNELGLAEATMVAASLPPNPKLSLSRMASGAELEIERKLVADILSLATLPARAEIAQDRFRQAQLRAAEETARLAADTRRAYYRAVASRQLSALLADAQSTAANAAELAKRLGQSGALNKLDQAREQVFYAEITAQLATARRDAASDREKLARALGLWGADLDFKLAAALPPLPAKPRTRPAVERDAIERRIDLRIARIEVEALGKSLGLTQATSLVHGLEVTGIDKELYPTGDPSDRQQGFELDVELPIFDGGETRRREAQEAYRRAANRLVEKAVNVRSEAREAYRGYRAAYDIAAHYQREVLPLRQIISDEMMLRYGAMQVDVFALLTEARQRVTSAAAAIEAQRAFWLAGVDLSTAIVGGGSGANTTVAGMAMPTQDSGGRH